MKRIFYIHWTACLLFLVLVAYIEPVGFGRERVIFGFGSAFALAIAVAQNGLYLERKRLKIDYFYYTANVVSLWTRAILEMSIFIYGSSLTDKWAVICIFGIFTIGAMLFDRFIIKDNY